MTDYEIASLVLSSIIGFITFGGVVYAGLQLKQAKEGIILTYRAQSADHDLQRRLAAQNSLNEYNKSIITSDLQIEFKYLNVKESIPLERIEKIFGENSALRNELHQLLNFYEGLARGVFQQIYDEEVIKSARKSSMAKALLAFRSYIEMRRREYAPNAWSDLDALVTKWEHESKLIYNRESTSLKP